MTTAQLVTIVPPQSQSGPVKTQGTKVILEDGTELRGITGIRLVACVDDVWRAEIDLHPRMGVFPRMLATIKTGKVAWWRRALIRLAGFHVDQTALEDDYRRLAP